MPKRKNNFNELAPAKNPRVSSGEGQDWVRRDSSHASSARLWAGKQPEEPQAKWSQRKITGKVKGKRKGNVGGKDMEKGMDVSKSNPTETQNLVDKVVLNDSTLKATINKLAPPRPFPTIPSSVSASGPRSRHKEGKNLICITRHSSLASYLGRCKKILTDEGYKILHLHGMGAAIPHLLTLAVSLPPILPFPRNEIKVEVRTGTIDVIDEIIPDDEHEDMILRTRSKGGVSVVIQIGGGKETEPISVGGKQTGEQGKTPKILVIQEQDQWEMDTDDENIE